MPYYLLLAFGGLWAVLFLRINRQWLYKVALSSVRVLDIMLSTKSDDAKLEVLPKATGKLLGSLFVCIILLAVAAGIGYLPFGSSEYLFGPSPSRPAWLELTALSVGASVPFFLPLRRVASNYSEISILLHRLILNHYAIGLKLFRREAKQKQKSGVNTRKDYVIVSGLARAGTTSMMNFIAKRPEFRSLSYANMPFLLSPNLWSKLYKPKKGKEVERSHRDGIKIGLRSYEALEEYYHKAMADDSFIAEKHLNKYSLSEEDALTYLRYQTLVRTSNEQIYLAKNNNFMLRYDSLREHNDDFVFVILFREPLSHAASLMEKHQQYVDLQNKDPFVLEYMNWLGHHEFGQGHKPFLFEGQKELIGKPENLDYWLQVWINYYNKALRLEHPKTLFISYEGFCADPKGNLNRIYSEIGLSEEAELPGFSNTRKVTAKAQEELIVEAQSIYQKLLNRCS